MESGPAIFARLSRESPAIVGESATDSSAGRREEVETCRKNGGPHEWLARHKAIGWQDELQTGQVRCRFVIKGVRRICGLAELAGRALQRQRDLCLVTALRSWMASWCPRHWRCLASSQRRPLGPGRSSGRASRVRCRLLRSCCTSRCLLRLRMCGQPPGMSYCTAPRTTKQKFPGQQLSAVLQIPSTRCVRGTKSRDHDDSKRCAKLPA